jgi:signal peptide peptidase SppA
MNKMVEKYGRILQLAIETPWAILPGKWQAIMGFLWFQAQGDKFSAGELATRIGAVQGPAERTEGTVAVLPIFGTIVPRADLFSEFSGGTSAEVLTRKFRSLVNDPNVGAIVLDVDSPGGAVSGVEEVASEIFKARGSKPIIAVANHLAASAAYWIATAADELVVTPSGEVGSIGVFAGHQDISGALETEGVKITLVNAGKFKVEGNPYEPLSEEARAAIQSRVDDYYNAFTRDVARHRGVKQSEVKGGFGEGRVVGAKEAVALGMADRVGTLDQVISDLTRRRGKRGASADIEFRERRLRTFQQ